MHKLNCTMNNEAGKSVEDRCGEYSSDCIPAKTSRLSWSSRVCQCEGNQSYEPTPFSNFVSGLALDKSVLLNSLDFKYEFEFDPKYEYKLGTV
jgi:hypothetical protein